MNSIVQAAGHEDPKLRFAFGRNWQSFLSTLDARRIDEARRRLCESLGRDDLRGIRALDIGSGSGLSSLVMHQLGADVVAFDYDTDSVARARSALYAKRHALTNHARPPPETASRKYGQAHSNGWNATW